MKYLTNDQMTYWKKRYLRILNQVEKHFENITID